MDIYDLLRNISDWLGWPIVTLVFVAASAYVYLILNQRIEGLKENRDLLEAKLKEAENFTPSALVERLAKRHKILTEELERLHAEQEIDKQLIQRLTHELHSILLELRQVSVQAETFILGLDRDISSYFSSWYSKGGYLHVFCNDLDWLSGQEFDEVVRALNRKGDELSLFLRKTEGPTVKALLDSGAKVFQTKSDFESVHRFSILINGSQKSIIIRNKTKEDGNLVFEEFPNQEVLVDLALDFLENSTDYEIT